MGRKKSKKFGNFGTVLDWNMIQVPFQRAFLESQHRVNNVKNLFCSSWPFSQILSHIVVSFLQALNSYITSLLSRRAH